MLGWRTTANDCCLVAYIRRNHNTNGAKVSACAETVHGLQGCASENPGGRCC